MQKKCDTLLWRNFPIPWFLKSVFFGWCWHATERKQTYSIITRQVNKKGACAQLQIRRGTRGLNREAKRGRGQRSPAATEAEAAKRWVLPAQAPSRSAAAPPVRPAAAVRSSSAAQTETRSPGHCSSGGRPEPAPHCACCSRDAGGRYTQHRSRSGAGSGGSLWTCWRYLLRTGSAGRLSCCPLNCDPHQWSAPELQLPDDSEQKTVGGGGVMFNNNCFNEEGTFKKSTHWTKGKVPAQAWPINQPIKVKLTVEFACEVDTKQWS